MKVVLAHRCPDEAAEQSDAQTVPAGLRWIAASLRAAGHEAIVANFSRLGWKDVEKYLAGASPQVLGISCLTSNRAPAARLARVARKTCPDVKIAMGGPHASAIPDLLLRRVRELDFVVVGEGEIAFAEACEALGRGAASSLVGVPGVALRGIPAGREAMPADLERLPRPVHGIAGAGLDPARDFRHVIAARQRAGGVATRSPGSVAQEVKELRDEFGVIDVSIVGPGLIGGSWLSDFAGTLLDDRIASSWDAFARAEDLAGHERGEALDLALHRARRAGCRRIRLQLDASTADPSMAEAFAEAARTLRETGLAAHLTIQHGLPGQAPTDLSLLRTLVRALRPREWSLEPIEVLPGTPSWTALAADEELDERFWFDESRAFIPAASPRELEVSEGALELTLREVAKSARPAARDLEAVHAIDPGSAWAEIEWGDWRASLGDFEEAERRYRIAAEAEPWNPFPWLRLGVLFGRGRTPEEGGIRLGGPEAAPDRERAALQQALLRVPKHPASRARVEALRAPAGHRRRVTVAKDRGKGPR